MGTFDFNKGMEKMLGGSGTGGSGGNDKINSMMGFGGGMEPQSPINTTTEEIIPNISGSGKMKIEISYDKEYITSNDIKNMIANIQGVKRVK